MMRRLLSSALGLGLVASSAMASGLVVIPKVTNMDPADPTVQAGVYPRAITPDGKYVGGVAGLGFSSGGVDVGFVWDADHGSRQIVAGAYQKTVDGIGYWTDGTTTKVVTEGNNAGSVAMNCSADGGTSWSKIRRTGTTYYGSGNNRMAGTSTGNLLHGVYQTSNQQLFIDSFNGTTFAAAPDSKGTTNDTTMNGVSNAGVVVGVRGGLAYKLTYQGTGGAAAAYVNAAPDGSQNATLYDIADDGSIMGGMGTWATKTGSWAFVYDGVTSTKLPDLGGSSVGLTNSAVYSIAPNGDYAVGMDYSKGYELAVLWDLRDMGNIKVTDLTQFAAANGILGAFDGNLRRATAIGIDQAGNPVIAGVGFASSLEANGWTGYVMTVPEPATVCLLALGGLVLRRRR